MNFERRRLSIKKKAAYCVVLLGVLVLAAFIGFDALNSQTAENNFSAMNTVVSLSVEGIGSKKAAAEIVKKTQELDLAVLSRTAKGSEIYKLNNSGSKKVEVSEFLAGVLADLQKLESDSGGAFCISLGALSDLWNIGDGSGYLPTESEIEDVLKNKNNLSVSGSTAIVSGGTVVDLGSAGKGIACDEAKKIVENSRCSEAIVAVGGSVLLWSKNNKSFKVGIRNPLGKANEYAAVLETGNACVSTSGSYEKFFTAPNGKTYHHIFDPSTGFSAQSGLQSVTVICDSGMMSDALSTACFVLGYEKSLPLLEKYNAQAVFITEQNEFLTSPGFSAKLTVTADDFTAGGAQ